MKEETNYLIPTGDGKGQIAIELEGVARAECRLNDVAIVNQHTAPEMLATFNDCWLKLAKTIAILMSERNKAENANRYAKAVAKLNCTDDAIKNKGHSKASADLREAMVELDTEVRQSKERLDEISVVHDLLKCKQQAFYNAYGAVKRLLDNRFLPEGHVGDANRPMPYSTPAPAPAPTPTSTSESDNTQVTDPDFEPLPQGFSVPRR